MIRNFKTSTTNDLRTFIKNKKFKKIFILTGNKSYKLSGIKNIFDKILKDKIAKIYFKKSPFPEYSELKKIIFSLREFSPDLIIAVGGGSVLDYAKVANVLQISKNLDKQIINSSYSINKKFTKLLAIPTTAGSGAEVTSNAVIYINKIKYSVEDEILKPDYFFLIPELISGASKKIKASSGFDAISQAIESLISKKSDFQSVFFAKKSLEISLRYYLNFLKKPNLSNTSAMCVAANLAGKAISISKTTAPHAVSYPFTAIYNVSHGHAVSLTLNEFLFFNYKNIKHAKCNFDLKKRYNILFSLIGGKTFADLDTYLLNLKQKANLENNFNKLGINLKSGLNNIMDGINAQRLLNNPVKLDKRDIRFILKQKNDLK